MKTYHIITIGCQMNKSDSERLASVLEARGYKWTPDKNKASIVAINTCGVRQSAEDRIYGLIPDIKKANPKVKIILTGCLVNRKDVRRRLNDYVDTWQPINELAKDYLKIKPSYDSNFSAFIPIGNGCDNYCSYCVVPAARGREVWRPAKDILAEARSLVKKGFKEITLIAQNVNSYKSGKFDFPDLLKAVDEIKGDFWLRFTTSHPKDMSDKLIKVIARGKKICEQIHLPAQAGDNRILKMMNRKYRREDYLKLIKKIKKALPEASLSTDIIVGFPGETKAQFNNSAKLMRAVKFDQAYVAQYSPRPGTAAAKLIDNVSKAEKKQRELILMKIVNKTALDNNKKYLGQSLKVLVENKNKSGEWVGKTRTGKYVKFLGDNKTDLIGKFVKVKINKLRDFGLAGVLVK